MALITIGKNLIKGKIMDKNIYYILKNILTVPDYTNELTLEDWVSLYKDFQEVVNNTPNHFPAKSQAWQNGLHAAIGLSTEAAELLDLYKKEAYGKMKPFDAERIRDEAGDAFYYLHALISAYGFSLEDIIKDNMIKLSKRYVEKFEASEKEVS